MKWVFIIEIWYKAPTDASHATDRERPDISVRISLPGLSLPSEALDSGQAKLQLANAVARAEIPIKASCYGRQTVAA